MTSDALGLLLHIHARLVERLYEKAQAGRWHVSAECFAQALHRSAEHHFREASRVAGLDPAAVAAYLESLHLEDLALACACSEGNAQAWEDFVGRYRRELYDAAGAIVSRSRTGGQAEARDLADSIYAELYGLDAAASGKGRKSLFDYFHGRSKLSTWLRAVLAQRHVDALRAGRRTESLEEADEAQMFRARGPAALPDPERARYVSLLQAALLKVLAALGPRDRLRLAYYYVHELTLAEIGRILGEHEATVSRHLDRTRRALRNQVERTLRVGIPSDQKLGARRGLSDAQIRLCFACAQEEWPFDLTRALSSEVLGPERGESGSGSGA